MRKLNCLPELIEESAYSSSDSNNRIEEFEESNFSKQNQIGSSSHVRIQNEGYSIDANEREVINTSSVDESSRR